MKSLVIIVAVILSLSSHVAFGMETNPENTQAKYGTMVLAQAEPVLDTSAIQQQVSESLQEKIEADFDEQYEKVFNLNR